MAPSSQWPAVARSFLARAIRPSCKLNSSVRHRQIRTSVSHRLTHQALGFLETTTYQEIQPVGQQVEILPGLLQTLLQQAFRFPNSPSVSQVFAIAASSTGLSGSG
jgi:hypothetical protein